MIDLVLERDLHGLSPYNALERVDFSPDGRKLAAAGFSGTVTLWSDDLRKNEWKVVTTFHAHDNEAQVARFSPDGHWIATAGSNSVLLLDGESGRILASAKLDALRQMGAFWQMGLLWSGTNTLVLTDPLAGVQLWEVERPLSHLARPHVGPRYSEDLKVRTLRFSQSDRWLGIGYDESSPGVIDLGQPDKTPAPSRVARGWRLWPSHRARRRCLVPS